MIRTWGERAVLVLLVAATTAIRVPAVLDDRTWYDEDYVFLQAQGIRYSAPWPECFTRPPFEWSRSFETALHNLAHHDAYPPLVTAALWTIGHTGDPIVLGRASFLLVSVLLPLVLYGWVRRESSPATALAAAAYVSFAPLLVETSQHLKWVAVAPTLATLSALLLLEMDHRFTWSKWGGYVVSTTAVLHTHYFCGWIVPAHALFVCLFARGLARRWLGAICVVALLCAPWYGLGLPSQRRYVAWFFEAWLTAQPASDWYQPLTIETFIRWLGWDLARGLGLLAQDERARYVLPLALPLLWFLARACRAPSARAAAAARLAVSTGGVALLAQTAYAAWLGHTTPLTVYYFVPWLPLLLLGVVIGGTAGSSRLWVAALWAIIAFSASNAVPPRHPGTLAGGPTIHRYAEVARLLAQEPAESIIVFRSDRDAKMTNVFYSGAHRQCVASTPTWQPPAEGASLVFVLPRGAQPAGAGTALRCAERETIRGETRLLRCARHAPPHPSR